MKAEEFHEIEALVAKVIKWAEDRNLINGSTAKDQTLKTVSEFGELCGNVAFSQGVDAFRDDVGDVMVTQIIVCVQMGVSWIDTLHMGAPFDEGSPYLCTMQKFLGLMADNVMKNQPEQYKANLTNFNHDLEAYTAGWPGIDPKAPLTLLECLRAAYDEIKDRKGVMYNGVFLKSTDARYVSACQELGIEG